MEELTDYKIAEDTVKVPVRLLRKMDMRSIW